MYFGLQYVLKGSQYNDAYYIVAQLHSVSFYLRKQMITNRIMYGLCNTIWCK